jgi:NADH dehydrogenase/NADH:ubiquinone oxidoreductase subunit G
MGAPVYVHFKNTEIFRVLPKSNSQINGSLINDKTRFSYDAGNNNRLTKGLTLNSSKTDYVNFK